MSNWHRVKWRHYQYSMCNDKLLNTGSAFTPKKKGNALFDSEVRLPSSQPYFCRPFPWLFYLRVFAQEKRWRTQFTLKAVFNWVSKEISLFLVLRYYTLYDCLRNLAPIYQPVRSKTKTKRVLPHAFSRAWCRLHVFALSSDWFIALFASLVIGQSDNFGFGFEILKWKRLY